MRMPRRSCVWSAILLVALGLAAPAVGDQSALSMLVVSRVDSEGRTYAVTNYNTEDGFIITEILLYHPDIPTVGMFPVWTERPNRQMGATGFGGFEVWRMRTR